MSKIILEDFISQNRAGFDQLELPTNMLNTIHTKALVGGHSIIQPLITKIIIGIVATTVAVVTYVNVSRNDVAVVEKPTNAISTPESSTTTFNENIAPAENPIIPNNNTNLQANAFEGNTMLPDNFDPDDEPFVYAQTNINRQSNKDTVYNKNGQTWEWSASGKNSKLNVDTIFSGINDIRVNASSFDIIVVGKQNSDKVLFKVDAKSESKGLVLSSSDIEITCEQIGGILKIAADFSGNSSGIGTFNMEGKIYIEIPANSAVNLKNSYGNIDLSDTHGNVCELHSESGNIKVNNVSSPINLHVTYGNVWLKQTKGTLNIDLGSGNLITENQTGDINLKVDYGNVKMTGVTGNITGESESGKIEITDITGNLNFDSDYTGFILNNTKGDLSIKCNSGNIQGTKVEILNAATFKSEYGNIDIDFVNDLNKMSFNLKSEYGNILVEDGTGRKQAEGAVIIERGGIQVNSKVESGNQVFK
ncbi:MAG: DUF4097 family beta strand repeat protein [Bacteroidetes bacterium]|nr:DUF4097 family beta strand repeat protein [Bacteroidota bacterium]